MENLYFQKNPFQGLISSLNAVISTKFIKGHMIYNLAYTYILQTTTTMIFNYLDLNSYVIFKRLEWLW